MSQCPTCGAPCELPLIARLRDRGFDPLEHCTMLAIHKGAITECKGHDVARQCHLCPVGRGLGTWTQTRGTWTFVPNGMSEEAK